MPASALRHARLDADLTLFDVQRETGIHQSRLSLIERGLVTARPDEQARVAQTLQCPVERLFHSPGHARQAKGRLLEDGDRVTPSLQRRGGRGGGHVTST